MLGESLLGRLSVIGAMTAALLMSSCDDKPDTGRRKVVPRTGETDGSYMHVPKGAFKALCAVNGEAGTGPVTVRKPGVAAQDAKEKSEDKATEIVRKMLGEFVASKGMREESVPLVWIDESVGENVAAAVVLLEDRPPLKEGTQIVRFSVKQLLKHTKGSGTRKTLHFIFAHELAHHINGHQLNRPGQHAHDKELEADYFAGFVMGQRGDTLEEVTAWIRKSAPVRSDNTHPGRQDRINHASEGWVKGCETSGKCNAKGADSTEDQPDAPTPPPTQPEGDGEQVF